MTITFLGITVVSDLYVLLLSTVTMSFAKAACNGGEFGAHIRSSVNPSRRPHPPTHFQRALIPASLRDPLAIRKLARARDL